MTMNIIQSIAKDLGIDQGVQESDMRFRDRVTLSALAKWMLAACYNGEGETSVEAVKAVTLEKLSFYKETLPHGTIGSIAAEGFNDIVEYVYQNLVSNGAFYHKAYYVCPHERRNLLFGAAMINQGTHPDEKCFFSGLAPLTNGNGEIDDLSAEFDLPAESPNFVVEMLWKRSVPVNEGIHIDEYLKFENLRTGYYTQRRMDTYPMTMGRSAHAGAGYEHYLIRQKEVRRIPDDYVEDVWHEYCQLAIINSTVQQKVTASIDQSLVNLSFGYKLPSKDLRFLRYIAWPTSLASIDGAFEFSMSRYAWPAVKTRLEKLNYKVEQI